MEPIKLLSKTGEVLVCPDDDQFGWGQSVMKCGYEIVALFWHSVAPGAILKYTSADVHTMAHNDYVKFAGPDVPGDQNGMTLKQLQDDMDSHNFHFIVCPMDFNYIRGWLNYGYPVIVAVTEDSVFDLVLGAKPYSWNTAGYNHIIMATGLNGPNALKFRDTANIGSNGVRPGPRPYDTNKLKLISATVAVPSWLPVPPAGFDPRPKEPIKTPPPVQQGHKWELIRDGKQIAEWTAPY